MYVSPQDYLDPISMGSSAVSDFAGDLAGDLGGSGSLLGATQGDDVSRFQPPGLSQAMGAAAAGTASALSPMSMLGPILGGIGSLLQNLGNMFAGGSGSQGQTQSPQPQQGQQQFFGNATASSTGDPHLAFNGTSAGGTNSNQKWNSMSSHSDLLDSNSFAGGYRVSTTVTAPNSSGVTYNQFATVTTRNGNDAVALGANGSATLTRNGQTSDIADGQSFSLGGGESVSRAQNGALTITDTNANGGSIATTLSQNGNGVDVNVQASNVDLGGDLAGGPNAQSSGAQTAWAPQPYGQQLPNNQPTRRYAMEESPMDIGAMD